MAQIKAKQEKTKVKLDKCLVKLNQKNTAQLGLNKAFVTFQTKAEARKVISKF